jgi:hypothetical protein
VQRVGATRRCNKLVQQVGATLGCLFRSRGNTHACSSSESQLRQHRTPFRTIGRFCDAPWLSALRDVPWSSACNVAKGVPPQPSGWYHSWCALSNKRRIYETRTKANTYQNSNFVCTHLLTQKHTLTYAQTHTTSANNTNLAQNRSEQGWPTDP